MSVNRVCYRKMKSNSFYLSNEMLERLDYIASIENKPRSVVVERALRYYLCLLSSKRDRYGKEKKQERAWRLSKEAYKSNTKTKKVRVTNERVRTVRLSFPALFEI